MRKKKSSFLQQCSLIRARSDALRRLSSRDSTDEFREPFAGSAAVGLGILAQGHQAVWLNDVDASLYQTWTAIQRHPDALKEAVRRFSPTVDEFRRVKEQFLASMSPPLTAEALVRLACDKIALHQLSFGHFGTMSGPRGGSNQASGGIAGRWNPARICERIDVIAGLLPNARLTNVDFEQVIDDDAPRATIYCDPPYAEAGKHFYRHPFTEQDHIRLRDVLRRTSHDWLLSYDDSPLVWDLYSNFAAIERVPVDYGSRSKKGRETYELLISPLSDSLGKVQRTSWHPYNASRDSAACAPSAEVHGPQDGPDLDTDQDFIPAGCNGNHNAVKNTPPHSGDALDEPTAAEPSGTEPSREENDNAATERPQADDTGRERTVHDDVGPNTSPAELVRRIQADRIDDSRATYASFRANLRTIVHLYWLHENIRALKKARASGVTVGGADYIAAADEAGVKRTMAYKIIECRLFSYIDDIWRKVEIEADQWRAQTGHDTYQYPSLTKMISWYKPSKRAPAPAQDEDEAEGLNEPNQTPKQLADEALRLTDALTTAQRDLEQARDDFRKERIKHDQDVDEYERRLKLKDQRIAYLEGRVQEFERPAPPEPEAAPMPEAAEEPAPEPVSEDARYRLADRGRKLAQVKELEARHAAPKWRGPLSRARQLRADFLAYLDSLGIVGMPADAPNDPAFWAEQDGVVADDIIARYGMPDAPLDPEPPPTSTAPVPGQEPDPEPAVSTSSAAEASSENEATAGRDALTQDVAKVIYGRMDIAKVAGSPSGLLVEAFDVTKMLFLRTNLTAHREVQDQFALEVLAKHEGRYLVREHPVEAAGEQAKIATIDWDVVVGPEAKSDFIAACKIAKADGEKTVSVDVVDGKLSFAPATWCFVRRDIEWVMRKELTSIKVSGKRGVFAVTARGIAGDYEFFLRGKIR